MISDKLPPPIELKEDTLEDSINYVYINYFKNEFMDKDRRNSLFGKFIFLDLDFIDFKPERFWHIISFKPEEEKYTVNPCVNAKDLILCKEFKADCYTCLCIPGDNKLKDRCECMYRLRRINWINPILELANEKDKSIKVWFEDEKDDKKMITRKIYIRFQEGLVDYIIILIDGSIIGKNGYKFVTAYPVVHNGTKIRLDKGYEKNKNKFKKAKSRSQHC